MVKNWIEPGDITLLAVAVDSANILVQPLHDGVEMPYLIDYSILASSSYSRCLA